MQTVLFGLALPLFPFLALGGGLFWVAAKLFREARQNARAIDLEIPPQFQGRLAYVIVGVLALIGVLVVLLPAVILLGLYVSD